MSELSREARAVLEAARGGDEPTAADRARVRTALAVALGSAAATGTAEAAATSSAAPGASGGMAAIGGGGWATGLKVLLAVALVGAGAGGYFALRGGGSTTDVPAAPAAMAAAPAMAPDAHRGVPAVTIEAMPLSTSDPSPAAAAAVVAEPASERAAETPAAAVEAEPASERAAAQRAGAKSNGDPRARNRAAPRTASLARERQLIAAANRALRDGDAAGALRLLDRHAADFDDGVLVQERATARVLALCELGRVEAARAEAASLLARWPRSPHAARIRASCAR
jgi:hypothetical protein